MRYFHSFSILAYDGLFENFAVVLPWHYYRKFLEVRIKKNGFLLTRLSAGLIFLVYDDDSNTIV